MLFQSKISLIVLLYSINFMFSQELIENNNINDYQISSEKYVPSQNGSILMHVNIWGKVVKPGRQLVYDGIDMATLLSIVGGPGSGANMKKVRLYREVADENGQLVYEINLDNFIRNGDRSDFIEIKPNDTILIPQTVTSLLLTQVGTLNTLLSFLNFYLIINSQFN